MNDRFLNMLGLCAKAGKCVFGETACLNAIRSGKVDLMIVDHNSSDNTRKRFTDACTFRNVPLINNYGDIGDAAGKPAGKLIAVTDKSFAQSLWQHAQSAKQE